MARGMLERYDVVDTDVLVIGAGGAGLRAAIEASKYNVDVTVVCKEMLGKAHTVMAEGGYNAALGNVDPRDDWKAHFMDTVEGGAWLNDQDLVEVFVKESPDRIFDLEEYGAAFDRTPDGKLAQRMFGKQRYPRTCHVSDYTGHELVAALVDEVRRRDIPVMEEVFISKLFKGNGRVAGALGIDIKSGEFLLFKCKAIVLAGGGAGRIYKITTNPASATGDGKILALEAGAELKDMEMFQFHPTAMVWPPSCRGILVTEAVRGEGGVLLNTKGERFMKRYHKLLELGPRDVVARSIMREVLEGRGTEHGGVYLSVTHLPPERIREKLKTMYRQFLLAGVDITKQPMEVAPAAHYYMGGVKQTVWGETSVKGLYVAGEEAAGLHGANRLGGNSIADTQVYGKRAGEAAARYARQAEKQLVDQRAVEEEQRRALSFLRSSETRPAKVKEAINETMWENAGIFRTEEGLKRALADLEAIKSKMIPEMGVSDQGSRRYNKEWIEALEAANMVRVAEILVRAALIRTESRGAHYRLDYPSTDNRSWLKHIVWYLDGGELKYRFEPVKITLAMPPGVS